MSILPNAIFNCDCLSLLERMEPGMVNLVYLDPPWFFQDNSFNSDNGEKSNFDKYLDFLAKVSQQTHHVLKEEGTLYFHVEPSLVGYVQLILDQVFGRNSFRMEIILPRRRRRFFSPKKVGNEHESILLYSKTDQFIYNHPRRPLTQNEVALTYRQEDKQGRYKLASLLSPIKRGNMNYEFHGIVPPLGQSWRYSKQEMANLEENGLVQFTASGNIPMLKIYLEEGAEVEVGNIWDDIPLYAPSNERKGSAAQRPLGLLDRIVKTGSNKENTVLDPFCGSGTTLLSAQRCGRKWIGCDIAFEAFEISIKRLANECQATRGVDFKAYNQQELLRLYSLVSPLFSPISTTLDIGALQIPTFILNQPVKIEETRIYEFKSISSRYPVSSIKSVADQYAVAFLNGAGGILFWGIKDHDRTVVGVRLTYRERDEIRRVVTEKLTGIQPSIAPTDYRLEFHQVFDKSVAVPDLYVIEMRVPKQKTKDLFFTNKNEAWVKTDGGKKKLSGPEIQMEIIKRQNL